MICAPDDLEYRDGTLRTGDFQIDLVYKRILIHEFLSRFDETHPLVRAYVNHHICLVNPFRCKIMHKKAGFELLTDQGGTRAGSRLPNRKRSGCCVPWTRRVIDRRTTRDGRSIELLNFIRRNRALLVLKPNDDYGGRRSFLGPRLDDRAWDDAIATALSGDYVAQDAIDLQPEDFPIFGENEWQLQPIC